MTEMFVAGKVDAESAWWLDIQHCESVTTPGSRRPPGVW